MLKKLKTWISNKKGIETIIFDYDGVLNDSIWAVRMAFNHLEIEGIANKSYNSDLAFLNDFIEHEGEKLEFLGVKEEDYPKCDGVIKKNLPFYDEKVDFYKGIPKVIEELKQRNYTLGIVSNGNQKIIQSKLAKYGLENHFDSIIGRYDVKEPKPSPEGIQKCIKELKTNSNKTAYIGDMKLDIQAGRGAEVQKLVLTTYGYYKDHLNLLEGGDNYITTPEEMLKIFK